MADKIDYQPATIEPKWQKYWDDHKTFKTKDEFDKPKYYVLDMFPYPSGAGLHVGHPEGYTATDIMARFKRMQGFNVLHPMGWDAFGLPAEQHAVRTGTHPRDTTRENIANFRRQIKSIGLSYDWDREVDTTDPKYYRWTQWIFRKLYEKGLAYQCEAPVNWCEELGTVLANEEVVDGKSEVGGFPVVKKPMRQWMLKITAYAERLLEDLELLDWPESIKDMQRHWIGKSVGADITFKIKGSDEAFQVFSTRPDTLFGASFCVLAPEHPLISKISSPEQQAEVSAYQQKAAQASERERMASDDKSGVFTGAYAINPVNGEKLPLYIADYVLMGYGHGAIMAVPAHDERDYAFAKKHGLAIKQVIAAKEADISEAAYTGDGVLMGSGFLDGLDKATAIEKMVAYLEEHQLGKPKVTYKLRDWLFSRQRYWGEPIPISFDEDGREVLVPEEDLPLILPDIDDYKPTGSGEPPLAKAKEWVFSEKGLRRETNTMPQWAGSCWYYLRFIDPHNDKAPFDGKKESYWMPVDLYVGGVEHAVLHLLYARFWHKVLYDLKVVSTPEPFQKLVNQGMILGENGEKMSKSRGNVVNPDEVIEKNGADAFRVYEMFMGPLEATKPWQTDAISGSLRFLKRTYRLLVDEKGQKKQTGQTSKALDKALHKTIKKVTEDTEAMRFNTALAAMMEFLNLAYKEGSFSEASAKDFILLLAPYAPHLAEELWEIYGHSQTLAYEPWPAFDPEKVVEDLQTISIQVNGKLRSTLEIPVNLGKDEVLARAKALPGVSRHLEGKTIRKEIFVPGKIVNFVVSG